MAKDKALVGTLALRNYEKDRKRIEGEIDGIVKLYNVYSPYIKTVQEATGAKDKQTKKEEEFTKAQTNSQVAFEESIAALEGH